MGSPVRGSRVKRGDFPTLGRPPRAGGGVMEHPPTSATMASRVRVSRLNRVDLPTLGRPTRAIVGFMEHPPVAASVVLACGDIACARRQQAGTTQVRLRGSELLHRNRVKPAVASLH